MKTMETCQDEALSNERMLALPPASFGALAALLYGVQPFEAAVMAEAGAPLAVVSLLAGLIAISRLRAKDLGDTLRI